MGVKSFNQYLSYFEQKEADGFSIYLIELGELSLPSGKMIVSDPFLSYNQRPLAMDLRPGKYPVTLVVAEIEPKHFRVGLVRVKLATGKPVDWELAVTDDVLPHELADLGANDFIGFEASSGLGMLIDAEFNEEYVEVLKKYYQCNQGANYYNDILSEEFLNASGHHPNSRNLGDWNVHYPTGDTNKNIMMFATGWGEGLFPAYWGVDEKGKVVELIIDFLVLGSFE